jgi:putative oxidoreductase
MSDQTHPAALHTNHTNILVNLMISVIRTLEKTPHSLIALLARILIALVFWKSALTKIEGFSIKDATFMLFEYEYNLPLIPPELAAYMATFAELTFPVLLLIGLASRFSALALLLMTLVIEIFVYPEAYILHGLWATALLLIIARGPGILAIDYLVRKKYMPE